MDHELIKDYYKIARDYIDLLETSFFQKRLDVSFLEAWDSFMFSYGMVMSRNLGDIDANEARRSQTRHREKGNKSSTKINHLRKVFVAKLIKEKMEKTEKMKEEKCRAIAIHEAAVQINSLKDEIINIDRNECPPWLNFKFLQGLLLERAGNGEPTLKSTFTNKMPKEELDNLALSQEIDLARS